MLRPTHALILVLLSVLALPAGAAAAPGRADLKLAKVAVTPAAAAPGAQVRVSDVVRNAGRRKAGASRVAYFLSKDAKKDKGDVRLSGARSVRTLLRGRRSSGGSGLTIPSSVAPGAWFVLACADAGGKVKERSEKDNCKAAALRVVAAGSGSSTVPAPGGGAAPAPGAGPAPAPGGGGNPPAPFAGTFMRTPDPLDVDPVPDTARAARKTFSPWIEGTLTATGADGTVYTLTIPDGALFSDEEITMTPVSTIGDLPLSQGLMGAVELEPHGLVLQKAATLTIDPPGADPALASQSAFMAHDEEGSDFHLYPVADTPVATLKLLHFSTAGVGLGTSADRAAVDGRPGARPLAQLEAALAEATRQDRNGEQSDLSTLGPPLLAYYDEAVKPRLIAAETSEALAPNAIANALSWARQLALVSLDQGPEYDARYADMLQRLMRILNNAVNETYTKCVSEHDLPAGARMLGWLRQAALLSIETDRGFDDFVRCARFEVDFDSTITTSGGFTGTQQSQSWSGSWHVKAENLLIEIGTGEIPQAPIKDAGSSYTHTTTIPSNSCTLTTTTTFTSMDDGKLFASLVLDINLRETPENGVPQPRRHKLRLHVNTPPKEWYQSQNSGCSSGTGTPYWNTWWDDFFGDFRGANSSVLLMDIDAGDQVGDLIADETFTGTRQSGGNSTQNETTGVQLWHKPQTAP